MVVEFLLVLSVWFQYRYAVSRKKGEKAMLVLFVLAILFFCYRLWELYG